MHKKYLLVQTAVGDYRQEVLNIVAEELGDRFLLLTGSEYFESSTKTRISLPNNLKTVKNIFFFNRRFLFQVGTIFDSVKASSIILEMNPRIVNVWLVLLVRLILGKKTVLWGHAWPRAGAASKSDQVRNMLRSLGSYILVYTDTQVKELRSRMPKKEIMSAPNSLYSVTQMRANESTRECFIYVGRLVPTKKPLLMLKAYKTAYSINKDIGNLLIVGDGPERKNCELFIEENELQHKVILFGHIAEIDMLRNLYSKSIVSLSPGYVGLSITQSLSFGTPILISKTESHAPEIEAAVGNKNCLFFTTNNHDDFAAKILDFWQNKDNWKTKQEEIIEDCKARYSAEIMARKLLEAFKKCQN